MTNGMQIKCLRRNDDAMKRLAGIKICILKAYKKGFKK